MKISQYTQAALFKGFLIGDSGTGKTGSLVSLVKAGYKLRIIDLDNGVRSLLTEARAQCPDKIDNIDVVSFADRTTHGPLGMRYDKPKTFINVLDTLDKWDDGSIPSQWGPEYILVLDSGSALGRAAYAWMNVLNPTVADKRQVFKAAQDAIEDILAKLTAPDFNAHVIIISHINYDEKKNKGFINFVGSALGPKVPKYVDVLLVAEKEGIGAQAKRIIRTVPNLQTDCKNPWWRDTPASLPLNEALITLFNKMKGN